MKISRAIYVIFLLCITPCGVPARALAVEAILGAKVW